MTGWIKLHRKILESAEWNTLRPEHKVVMITCLMLANHEPKKWFWEGKKYTLSPGQFITSYRSLSQKCGSGVSIQNVRTAISTLEATRFLTWEPTHRNSIVTICNWGSYQNETKQANTDTNTVYKQNPTHYQHTANTLLTSTKNIKNNKNEKKIRKEGDFFQKNGHDEKVLPPPKKILK